MTIAGTPTKLRSGAWGAKVQGSVSEGDTIQITTRSGKSWTATVSKVVWSGDGVAICATESLDRPSSYARRYGADENCHTDDNCSSMCPHNSSCPCYDGGWFRCC